MCTRCVPAEIISRVCVGRPEHFAAALGHSAATFAAFDALVCGDLRRYSELHPVLHLPLVGQTSSSSSRCWPDVLIFIRPLSVNSISDCERQVGPSIDPSSTRLSRAVVKSRSSEPGQTVAVVARSAAPDSAS